MTNDNNEIQVLDDENLNRVRAAAKIYAAGAIRVAAKEAVESEGKDA